MRTNKKIKRKNVRKTDSPIGYDINLEGWVLGRRCFKEPVIGTYGQYFASQSKVYIEKPTDVIVEDIYYIQYKPDRDKLRREDIGKL